MPLVRDVGCTHTIERLMVILSTACPLHTLWHLLDQVLAHYAPYDPDDPAVLLKCRSEGVVLDELLVPLPVILAHLAKNSAIAREYMHSSLFPRGLYVTISVGVTVWHLSSSTGIAQNLWSNVPIFWVAVSV